MTEALIALFAEIFECDAALLSGESRFREHENWDSLTYLATVAMIDERFDVVVTQESLRKLKTIAELAAHIAARKAA